MSDGTVIHAKDRFTKREDSDQWDIELEIQTNLGLLFMVIVGLVLRKDIKINRVYDYNPVELVGDDDDQ